MPQKKIVIKLNYSAATPNNLDGSETGLTVQTEWNYKRIVSAFALLLFLTVTLYLGLSGFFSSEQGSSESAAQATTRVKEESIKNNGIENKIDPAPSSVSERSPRQLEKASVAVAEGDQPSSHSAAVVKPAQSETQVDKPSRDSVDSAVVTRPAQISISNDPTIKPIPGSGIARVQFTRKMLNREPVGQVSSPVFLPGNGSDELYLFTEFKSIKGAKRAHEWLKGQQLIAKREFPVGGSRWRVYSRKKLNRTMLGDWTVRVTDGADLVFAEYSFELK